MEWLLELNRSLDYIEEQLEGNMQLEQIAGEAAKIARCSAYHYQRIFSYLAGMTLSEYLRRRRMTLAAGHLRAGEKVLDTAVTVVSYLAFPLSAPGAEFVKEFNKGS